MEQTDEYSGSYYFLVFLVLTMFALIGMIVLFGATADIDKVWLSAVGLVECSLSAIILYSLWAYVSCF